jgi:hypothetical protein
MLVPATRIGDEEVATRKRKVMSWQWNKPTRDLREKKRESEERAQKERSK